MRVGDLVCLDEGPGALRDSVGVFDRSTDDKKISDVFNVQDVGLVVAVIRRDQYLVAQELIGLVLHGSVVWSSSSFLKKITT